jgi:hypothetical protein
MDTEGTENISTGPILGTELEGIETTKYPLITSSIELSVRTQFNSWEIAEYYLKEHGRQNGFVIKRYQVEYNKDHTVKRRTLTCENAGKYKPNKTKPIEQQRNKGSKKTGCKWHVNLSNPDHGNYIHITFANLEHNHIINADNKKFASAFRRFDENVMSEIEHAVVYGQCDAHTIRKLLQPLFPDQLFLTQDLSNAIQKIKREKKINGTDASQLLKFLLNQQKEEPTMFVQPLINVDSNRLCGVFWMIANQIILWSRYSDVVLHDNTSRTNKYNYPLSLFIFVDNEGKSCLGAQAFLNDETQESYEWILQQTLDATGSEPRVIIVIITDMDPAMDAACKIIYKNTYHIHCIWHLSQNLPKRLKSKLGTTNFKAFINEFWKAQNALCVDVFELRFQALMEKYPEACDYLQSTIYPTR